MSLSGLSMHGYTVVAGLGGRAITQGSLRRMLTDAVDDRLEPLTFLDLDHRLVELELQRMRRQRRSGPAAESILRDVGAVGARIS
jgi:pyruvate ferredoxin oxidoreductase alpha subunit